VTLTDGLVRSVEDLREEPQMKPETKPETKQETKQPFKTEVKKLIAGVTMAGLVVTGTASAAYAADSGSGSPANGAAKTEQGAPGHRRAGAVLGVAAAAIGIDRAELVKGAREGKSVADIAKEHGVEAKAVEDALVAAGTKRVDTAVANGRIDADRAATITGKLPQRAEKLVETPLQGKLHRKAARVKLRRHARRAGFRIAAETIGVSAKDLLAAVKGGSSIATVAGQHSVTPQAVVDAVVNAAGAKLDAAVANGKLDAERAATIKDRLPERVTNAVNRTPKG
jgi:transposase-like protein